MISGCLGKDRENAVVKCEQGFEEAGFPPTSKSLRQLAFSCAEKIYIPHLFNRYSKLAVYDWLQLFLIRHLELTVREAQGFSIAYGLRMCWQYVNNSFTVLLQIFQQNGFQANPRKITCMIVFC